MNIVQNHYYIKLCKMMIFKFYPPLPNLFKFFSKELFYINYWVTLKYSVYRNCNKSFKKFFLPISIIMSWYSNNCPAQGDWGDGRCLGPWLTKRHHVSLGGQQKTGNSWAGDKRHSLIQQHELHVQVSSPCFPSPWADALHVVGCIRAEKHWALRMRSHVCPGGRHYSDLGASLFSANRTLIKGLGKERSGPCVLYTPNKNT